MAQLIVRKISRTIVDALKRRAAAHGRSTEAEHRALLEETLLKNRGRSFKEHLLAMPPAGDDADFETARDGARRVEL
jgi:plasmid stability protein